MAPEDSPKPDSEKSPPQGALRGLGLAMSLPFTLIVSVILGGGAGYLIDRWLHTIPIFSLILGVVGFGAGLWDILRQLSKEEKREQGNGG
jgi:ATP synthase protein I